MKKTSQTGYPPFDPARFKVAITDACKFWQNKLALTDWFIDAPLVSDEPRDKGFKTTYQAGYNNASLFYSSPDRDWSGISNEWCAMAVGHELVHLLFSPIVSLLKTNLDGRWYDEMHCSEESVADRLTALVWGLCQEEERVRIIGLFAVARKA